MAPLVQSAGERIARQVFAATGKGPAVRKPLAAGWGPDWGPPEPEPVWWPGLPLTATGPGRLFALCIRGPLRAGWGPGPEGWEPTLEPPWGPVWGPGTLRAPGCTQLFGRREGHSLRNLVARKIILEGARLRDPAGWGSQPTEP